MLLFNSAANNRKIEKIMSAIMLILITFVACNMEEVVEKKPEKTEKATIAQNGKSVIIDPGHGGTDPGKVGVSKSLEKDINLAISRILKGQLEQKGYKVVLTREEDEHLSEGKFVKIKDLNKRCYIINEEYENNTDSIMISIHQNSFTDSRVRGAQCFYYSSSDKSKKLADVCQTNLNDAINQSDKKTKPNDKYYMLINSRCPGIIIECGFLSCYEEEQNLQNKDYQNKLSKVIVSAIEQYWQD